MNKPNPDTDLLRRAATKARETAQAATPWPWVPERKGVLDGGDIEFVEATRRDAPHIALWHPGVALAVAEWLDNCAAAASEWWNSAPPGAAARDPELHQESFASMYHYPLAVARALLGEDT